MIDFIWSVIVVFCIGLIYLLVSMISWELFSFIKDPVLHSLCAFLGVYFFHTKLIFKG